jgi:hypothetical protein
MVAHASNPFAVAQFMTGADEPLSATMRSVGIGFRHGGYFLSTMDAYQPVANSSELTG